jgi:hypothetical protein
MPSECAVSRVVVVPWWSQSRHRQTTVFTDAIASMLITSVAGREIVTVMVPDPFPERWVTSVRRVAMRAAVRSCGVRSGPPMDRAGMITVVAQCGPHAVHVPASTVGEVPVIRCTPWVAPHPGQV